MISQEDIAYAAADLEPNTAAAVSIWEDRWAKELGDTVPLGRRCIVEGARIPAALVEPALQASDAG